MSAPAKFGIWCDRAHLKGHHIRRTPCISGLHASHSAEGAFFAASGAHNCLSTAKNLATCCRVRGFVLCVWAWVELNYRPHAYQATDTQRADSACYTNQRLTSSFA